MKKIYKCYYRIDNCPSLPDDAIQRYGPMQKKFFIYVATISKNMFKHQLRSVLLKSHCKIKLYKFSII